MVRLTEVQACRAFQYSTALACDEGESSPKDCAGLILYNAEAATRLALDAIQLLGMDQEDAF